MKKKAHFLLIAKNNQRRLREDIQTLDKEDLNPAVETIDKGHGRLEIRSIRTTTKLNDYVEFPHVKQVFHLTRNVIDLKTNKQSTEVVYGLTSLTPETAGPERLLKLVRGHWAIENRSHYVRDVTFNEDHSRIRTKNGPQIMAALRNFAIGFLRLLGFTNIAKALRHFAAKTHQLFYALGI